MNQAKAARRPGRAKGKEEGGPRRASTSSAPLGCREGATAGATKPASGGADPGATTLAPRAGTQTGPPNGGDVVAGWAAGARVAGVPETTLRRLVVEGRLAAEKREDGVRLLSRAALEGIRRERTGRGGGEVDELAAVSGGKDAEGELAAQAFELFAAGKTPREAVVILRRPPPVVQRLFEEWASLGGSVVLGPLTLEMISRRAGGVPVATAKDLAYLLAALFSDRDELRRFRYACSGCKRPMQATSGNEWQWLLDKGHLSTWACAECAKKAE